MSTPPPPAHPAPPSQPDPPAAEGSRSRLRWIIGCSAALVLALLLLIGGCSALLVTYSPDDALPVDEQSTAITEETGPSDSPQDTLDDAPSQSAETDAPSTSPEPEPTAEPPAPPAEAPSYSGSGSEVVILDPLGEDVFYATVTHDGSSNVALWSVDENGQDIDLLVNQIGDYEGDVPINLEQTPAALRMEADGEWTIQFHHLSEAPRWDGTGTYEAHGDAVVIVDGAADGLTPVSLTHDGESNFAAWAYGDSYPDLIVNEIGTYEGTTLLPDGSLVLVVNADGTWSITRS